MAKDWADYLPEQQRRQRNRKRQRTRLLAHFGQRRTVIRLCVGAYLLWCLALLVQGMVFAFILSLLLILFLPAIGYLAWWLVWKEFND